MAKRRHKKKRPLPARIGETPTAERYQQQDGVVREVIERNINGEAIMLRSRARCECMLDAYLIRELITLREYQAGMKFRKAWLRARCGIAVADRFSAAAPVSYEESLYILSESERLLNEAYSVLTSAQQRIVLRVCTDDKLAGGTDKIETLRRGLVRLAKRWRLREDN